MSKNLKTIISLVILAIIVVIVVMISVTKEEENELLRNAENKIIYFYGEGCPHCANVEQFLEENNIEEKIQFEKKEIYSSKENANLLLLIAKEKCKLSENEIGVPFLWDKGTCLMGDEPIIDNFKEKLKI